MSRKYIDRETVRRLISSRRSKGQMEWVFESIPVADVRENVHGEWIESEYGMYLLCSKCWEESESLKQTNFCPNCGADMKTEMKS